MRKKIVYVVNVDWFFLSHRLPLALEALRIGCDVFLVAKDSGRGDEVRSYGIKFINLDFERSGKNPLKELKVIFDLRRIYDQIQPDVLHHVTLKPCIYGTIASRKLSRKIRTINAISGLGYTFTNNRNSLRKIILLRLMKWSFSTKETSFIFQNPDDKKFYDALGYLNKDNFIVIKGSGVDEKHFSYEYPKKKQKVTIILLARMLKDKGIQEFIDAANILKNEHSSMSEFILVGGIDEENPAHIEEKELIAQCDQEYIKWLGHRSDVKELYVNADIVCLPSYREGLPKSLIEAMAVGRPIITTDAIGCKECVDDGVNGYLVPVKDNTILAERIKRLILNRELRIKMGIESREKMVREMSLNKVIKETFKFYEG